MRKSWLQDELPGSGLMRQAYSLCVPLSALHQMLLSEGCRANHLSSPAQPPTEPGGGSHNDCGLFLHVKLAAEAGDVCHEKQYSTILSLLVCVDKPTITLCPFSVLHFISNVIQWVIALKM